ncbi:sulfurtransferase [Pontixanthobacter aquaemixtae]|uniref:Sulfurtransferase n=1 Tax=Pontixanthobacter aquaemixtae TaxID=1958940 RepID=A0A844ZVL0_9SPHN|nr:sulfurtransferase [Pontixanthobacter aquaemixtae]MXO89569.1 sulfurtransferase [Pontixanthobacter aquaemixtae]
MDKLVSTQDLHKQLAADDLVILDASGHLPSAARSAADEFLVEHIADARYLDLPTLTDQSSAVPSALPSPEQFGLRLQQLGITPNHRVVLYDDSALRSSARAFFIFTMFGFGNVAVLDGGLAKWRAEGRPMEAGETKCSTSTHVAFSANLSRIRDKASVLTNCASRQEQLVDARDEDRFSGESEDSVHGLPGGHIPGSRHLHFARLLRPDGTFKTESEMRALFDEAGIDLNRPITASCGSGMTAAVLLFALDLLGHEQTALYDGSWSEWGADPDTPKETGYAR